jgi:nuclear transcription factor Y gamma
MEYEKQLKDKFTEIKNEISKLPAEPEKFKDHALPLARIKKIMKLDDEVQMVSGESPILFSKACELFIIELAYRSWVHTLENNRRTLQRNDISQAISNTDFYDFLLDIVHESCKKKLLNCAQNYGPNPNFQIQNILQKTQLNSFQNDTIGQNGNCVNNNNFNNQNINNNNKDLNDNNK